MHPTRAFNASARDLPARAGSAPGPHARCPPARTRSARYRLARTGRTNALVQRNLRARANGRSKTGAAHESVTTAVTAVTASAPGTASVIHGKS